MARRGREGHSAGGTLGDRRTATMASLGVLSLLGLIARSTAELDLSTAEFVKKNIFCNKTALILQECKRNVN